jgi:hypothetical protein
MWCLKSVKFPKLDRSPLIGGGLVTLDLSAGFVATLASSASQNSEQYCTYTCGSMEQMHSFPSMIAHAPTALHIGCFLFFSAPRRVKLDLLIPHFRSMCFLVAQQNSGTNIFGTFIELRSVLSSKDLKKSPRMVQLFQAKCLEQTLQTNVTKAQLKYVVKKIQVFTASRTYIARENKE